MTLWKPNEIQRNAILLLEAAAILHDIGKLSNGFLYRVSSDNEERAKVHDFDYDYELRADPRVVFAYAQDHDRNDKASEDIEDLKRAAADRERAHNSALASAKLTVGAPFLDAPELTTQLAQASLTAWDGATYNLAEIVLLAAGKHANTNWQTALGKTMQPARLIGVLHGVAHFEKEDGTQQQPYAASYLATPFGQERLIDIQSAVETLTAMLQRLPLANLATTLTAADNQAGLYTARMAWLDEMKSILQSTFADNQRPTNEVTLWDWSFTVAALTKAAAVQIYQQGWPSGVDTYSYLQSLSYRTLAVCVDRVALYTKSDKITDLLGVGATLDRAYRKVRRLLEEEYAYGNCFYEDETGAYYLVPGNFTDSTLQELYQAILACFPFDLRPILKLCTQAATTVQLDPRSGNRDIGAIRGLVAAPRQEALVAIANPVQSESNFVDWSFAWADEQRPPNAEICTVCGVRPTGYPLAADQCPEDEVIELWATPEKARQRNICRICLTRRGRRAQAWARGSQQRTIWTDEVADQNGRLALFVGTFDLDGWLDGSLIQTLKVNRRTPKNPSPARLYRIAESARSFWETVTSELVRQPRAGAPAAALGEQAPSSNHAPVVAPRAYRFALYPAPQQWASLRAALGAFHTYEIAVAGAGTSGSLLLNVLWDPDNARFLTIENLDYFARRWIATPAPDDLTGRLERTLKAAPAMLSEPSGYLNDEQAIASVQIGRVERLPAYTPVISLLAEPSLCLLMLPAADALNFAEAVKAYYECAMGRVRDRLPMNLGLLFFPRRTPVRAVLEAGRAMAAMGEGTGWQEWEVVAANPPGRVVKDQGFQLVGVTTRVLTFDNRVAWQVPIVAGDNQTADGWYPHFLVNKQVRSNLSLVAQFATATKHVGAIEPRHPLASPGRGDKLLVRPSRFDFEFLDVSGRRYAIAYDQSGVRRQRKRRPYLLEDLTRFAIIWENMCDLGIAQRHQVVRTIEATRELWADPLQPSLIEEDAVFGQFVADTLAGAAWRGSAWHQRPALVRELLIAAGIRGELADLLELHLQILKEDV